MNLEGFVQETLECKWALITGGLIFVIGLWHVTKSTYSIFRFVFRMMLPPIYFKKFGNWVAVTGATDGIGKAYCHEFAKRGLNVCLLSRTESKLNQTADELKSKYGVETKTLPVDFGNVSEQKWNEISKLMADLEVGILVNNVGCSYDYCEYFHLIDDSKIKELIEINIKATVGMTRAVLPGMLARKKGMVLNIGSGSASAVPSSPLLTVYAATKAFVDTFTKSCCVEYKEKGVFFQVQSPLFVSTKMSKIRYGHPSPLDTGTHRWTKDAIHQIGNGMLSAGYWVHNLMYGILAALPVTVVNAYVLSLHKKIRSRALRKLGKKDN